MLTSVIFLFLFHTNNVDQTDPQEKPAVSCGVCKKLPLSVFQVTYLVISGRGPGRY